MRNNFIILKVTNNEIFSISETIFTNTIYSCLCCLENVVNKENDD